MTDETRRRPEGSSDGSGPSAERLAGRGAHPSDTLSSLALSDGLSDAVLAEAGMRPCGWPDCPERFDAYGHIFTGTNVQPGWRRSNIVGYLGPAHRDAVHLPRLGRTETGADVACDCGWRHENPPTLGTAADLWRDHVRAVSV